MAWTVGQKLQSRKYTIERELGRGRFDITYLAKDEGGNYLVIKTLDEDLLNKLTPAERDILESKFSGEALKLERCKHPHIVRVQETFKEGQLFCIAMEYIAGDTLATLPRRVLPEKEALDYIRQIGEALIKAHRQGLLHRDVKPANIMVRLGKYEAVLIDFELAEEFDHPLISKSRAEQFAPIELNSSKTPRGAYTDVYSLAATLYVLLTGQMPVKAVDRKNAKASLIPPKEINPQISARVNQAILAGMSVESELRPQTMGEWLNLLELRRGISIPCLPWEQPRWVMVLEILGVVGVLAGVISATINITDFLQKDSSSPYPSPIPSATPKAEVTPTTKSLLILSEVPGKGSLEQ